MLDQIRWRKDAVLRWIAALGFVRPAARNIVLRRAGIKVDQARILRGLSVTGRGLSIGTGVFINVDCLIEAEGVVDIAPNVSIAMGVKLLTVTHEVGASDKRAGKMQVSPIRIGRGSWIGAGAIVLPGVEVGQGSVIGAGAVVTKDVPPNSTVVGTPARVVKRLD